VSVISSESAVVDPGSTQMYPSDSCETDGECAESVSAAMSAIVEGVTVEGALIDAGSM
jgi:hypothetical protein